MVFADVKHHVHLLVDVKQHEKEIVRTELRSCVKVEVAVLGSPSLINHTISEDEKHQERRRRQQHTQLPADCIQ